MASKLKDQQAIRPGMLIAVAAVGAAAVAFFIVNMLIGGGGGGGSSDTAATVTKPAVQPIPNLNIPTAPPAPPGTGRDPFQAVAGAGATPAPVATAAPAPAPAARATVETTAPTAKPEFQATAGSKQYVEVISVSANRSTAEIRNGTIVYEQARPGQTLDRNVVVDSIDANRCVHLHRGTTSNVLCAGNKVLM
jgi:hypothetical protein